MARSSVDIHGARGVIGQSPPSASGPSALCLPPSAVRPFPSALCPPPSALYVLRTAYGVPRISSRVLPEKPQASGGNSRFEQPRWPAHALSKWGGYVKFSGWLRYPSGTYLRRHSGSFGPANVSGPWRGPRLADGADLACGVDFLDCLCWVGGGHRLDGPTDCGRGGPRPDCRGFERGGFAGLSTAGPPFRAAPQVSESGGAALAARTGWPDRYSEKDLTISGAAERLHGGTHGEYGRSRRR